ncbi:penicillin acylase family protein [Mesorhizobium sp. KR2-14]|uniref:penicillin acylase family protein n=1 Tax=Mesorhizobium sp. KR2-14 TaxID=3156610 RepID=UPI0032B61263
MLSTQQIQMPSERRLQIAGLKDAVEIAVDRWGIAHIRASNADDLFFAQGYNAARDRLWQIDLWRKRGLGLLAADFGPGYLAQDRASRLFLYRGEMDREWASYAPDARQICEAYVAGINSYVARIESGEEKLPLEFTLLKTRPARWKAEDVVRIRSHCLTRNGISEILRAIVLSKAGDKADAIRKQLTPSVSPVTAPDLDLSSIPLAALDVFKLATASVSFSPERLNAPLEAAGRWIQVNGVGDIVQRAESEGSNNWAIAPERTSTGRPIMAMDPHRTHAVPSLRYMVHLSMPGFDAIGAGEPAVPGISMGHNGHSAFSLTIFGGDQEDVYVYETRDGDPASYRYADGWEKMSVVEEVFEVKGYPDQRLSLQFTRHGPVLLEDREMQRAYALRTVWTEPGSAPYMTSLSVMRAKSISEYRSALRNWGTPSINHLYADVTGTIGWQTVGMTPVRPNWNGLVPVPGDGRYEWDGFVAPDALPASTNPQSGFLATANEMNLPQEWLEKHSPVGYEWIDASRAQRIHSVLEGQPSHRLEDSCALQNDLHSMPAERMQAVLRPLAFGLDLARQAASHLLGWDCWMGAQSSAAALFEVWVTSHLKPALYEQFASDPKVRALLQPGDIQSVLDVMESPADWFEGDAFEHRNAIMERTLEAAWRDCAARFGDRPDKWEWGKLHRLLLEHAVAKAFPETAAALDIEAIELGGSGSTPMYAVYRPNDYQTITGPSVRMVIDVGAWDNGLFINLPGQSGAPESGHYRDLTTAWTKGEYNPLVYSREAVDRETVARIVLSPQ